MSNPIFRSIACAAAIVALGVSSSPGVQGAQGTQLETATINQIHARPSVLAALPASQDETGRGWAALIGCAACAIAAGAIVAGGPAAILIAVNTPGSAVALLACGASCYEAMT